MKTKYSIAKENYDLIKEVGFFEQLQVNVDSVSHLINHV
jgi:hypothetical protein